MSSTRSARIFAAAALLLSLAGASGLAPLIAASIGSNHLAYTDTAEQGDPPEVAAGIAMGAFRGLFVNFLWMRANDLKQDGRFHESIELARAITKLQPRFPRVWAFHAWNLAYNISVATQTPDERWTWVIAGVNLLKKEGIPANPNDMMLHRELAWIYLHKIGGYTDDSNRYYKRRLASDWTILLGEPPVPALGSSSRDAVIDQYARWLAAVNDAPDTLEQLTRDNPAVARLVADVERDTGLQPSRKLLDLYVFHSNLDRSVRSGEIRAQFGENNRALAALVQDPARRDAWDALAAHLRRRAIIDDEGMNPYAMLRFTRKYGPIDWRHPAAHSLYWAARGVEQGLTRVTDQNEKDFDFLNTDRYVLQSIQELWRYGTVYFNFIDFLTDGAGYYQASPNEHFVASYGSLAEEIEQRGGVFESDGRVYRQYAAGYENFLTDAVLFFYRRGQTEEAQRWYQEIRTYDNQNIHSPIARLQDMSLPLEDFVARNQYDRFRSPNVAAAEIIGAIQNAFSTILTGQTDRYQALVQYAADAHRYYMGELDKGLQTGEGQLRDTIAGAAANAGDARMEVLNRDFRKVIGTAFAQTVTAMPPAEASLLYNRVGTDLRLFAYDPLMAIYTPIIERGDVTLDEPLDVLFPQPEGIEAFRAQQRRELEAQRQRGVEGINRQ